MWNLTISVVAQNKKAWDTYIHFQRSKGALLYLLYNEMSIKSKPRPIAANGGHTVLVVIFIIYFTVSGVIL